MSMTDENLVVEENETPEVDNSQDDQNDENGTDAKSIRHSQQMEGSKKEVDRYKTIALETAVEAAKVNANTLLELHKKDPKLAKEAAGKLDFASSEWGSYENFINGKTSTLGSKTVTEDDIERIVQEREAKKEHERAVKKAEKIIGKLSDDLQEKAQTYFQKISKDQLLDEDTAEEFAEMATLYVNKDKIKGEKYDQGLAEFASTGISNSKKASKDKDTSFIANGKFYDSNNDK